MFNESFYRSDPADYLRTRLQLLVLTGARLADLSQLFAPGVEYAGIRFGQAADEEPPITADEPLTNHSVESFLTIESQTLLHHACETVLRLFLLHAEQPHVPWVGLSEHRSFSKFKSHVRTTFIIATPTPETIGYVCLGRSDCPDAAQEAAWNQAIDEIGAFLRAFAECFLDDANLYNGIKHGLGVSAGSAVAILADMKLGHGPSVEFPESKEWQGDTREWALTTRWVDRPYSLALTLYAVELIDSIWKLGRCRYLGGEFELPLFVPKGFRPSDLRDPEGPAIGRFSWALLEQRRPPKS